MGRNGLKREVPLFGHPSIARAGASFQLFFWRGQNFFVFPMPPDLKNWKNSTVYVVI